MRAPTIGILTLLVSVGLRAADTRCPLSLPGYGDLHRIAVTDPDPSGRQFVACGAPLSHDQNPSRVNALHLYEAGNDEPLLSFDGTEDALVYASKRELRVVAISRYPAGKDWRWIEIPIAEWRFDGDHPRPAPRPVFPPLGVSQSQVTSFLKAYSEWVKLPSNDATIEKTEEMIGRLAAAATAGYESAQRLFATAGHDAHLDGGYGEEYEYYWAYYMWVQPHAAQKYPRPAN